MLPFLSSSHRGCSKTDGKKAKIFARFAVFKSPPAPGWLKEINLIQAQHTARERFVSIAGEIRNKLNYLGWIYFLARHSGSGKGWEVLPPHKTKPNSPESRAGDFLRAPGLGSALLLPLISRELQSNLGQKLWKSSLNTLRIFIHPDKWNKSSISRGLNYFKGVPTDPCCRLE